MAEARRIALKNLAEITDAEDAAITADAVADPDNPPADDLIRRRGRPPLENGKRPVKLRLDPDVIEHFRASGPGWQTRMNDALREAAGLKKAG
ncbi:BrnA antitoxin family protein [Nitratireductor soli]|uniref:BrnA antitoxin family protein n=1 Tax=Nitratireductor soli TaxID=1670619 RepID=UPI000A81EEC2|nr:BrnA antitoxin family protein [Nitratireductor soli]